MLVLVGIFGASRKGPPNERAWILEFPHVQKVEQHFARLKHILQVNVHNCMMMMMTRRFTACITTTTTIFAHKKVYNGFGYRRLLKRRSTQMSFHRGGIRWRAYGRQGSVCCC